MATERPKTGSSRWERDRKRNAGERRGQLHPHLTKPGYRPELKLQECRVNYVKCKGHAIIAVNKK